MNSFSRISFNNYCYTKVQDYSPISNLSSLPNTKIQPWSNASKKSDFLENLEQEERHARLVCQKQ